MPQTVFMQAALEQASEGFIGFTSDFRTLFCNTAAARILGIAYPRRTDDIIEAMMAGSSAFDHSTRSAFCMLVRTAASTGSEQGRFRRSHRIDLPCDHTLEVDLTLLEDDAILAKLNIRHGSMLPAEQTDSLTGLSDRLWFRQSLSTLLDGASDKVQVAVLMIDLDRFKAVNDTHGHPIGDALLQLAAQRLRAAVRERDIVSRLGGDEFAVVMPAPGQADDVGARLVDLLGRPYLIEDRVATVGASIGIAIGPRDGATAAELARAADLALYQAKADGRGAVRKFERWMDARARARSNLEAELRRALVLRQFELHYQPQVNLAQRKLVGFEALLRWRHPKLGLVPPDQFIPLAEEIGAIVPIGEWVLRTACRDAASWPDELTVAVNVSARQLADRHRLPRLAASALAESGLPGCRLEIEVTESALMCQQEDALQVLHALRELGIRMSMDDFGTGYSSLSQLRSFPFHKLKIDQSFIRDIAHSSQAVAAIRAIAALGASMGMTTTAEGVETVEQEALVRADGCTDMQGYLVSPAVRANDIPTLIRRLGAAVTAMEEPVQ
ncbi:MAG TPA: EAL domain-containing protein [Geminicoccus sp.]|uniref:putative bifunctional diguanylate cyclase/phosphodiesterase n=1 Tax=Geminicoccus sp. TaxID=2024832 RepID=UPI002E2F7E9E|nr:EAL domain-containing protein [Geminicoccus sp.]HEX2525486.1 EAL domain-containing protein [Geminicoccus sp.]